MSLTVTQLNKNAMKFKDLDSIIKEQLLIIDDKLLKKDKSWGTNMVIHELPILFAGLDKKNAQRVVYSNIILSLEKRGFDVKILLEDTRTVIYIKWETNFSDSDINKMNNLINQKRISSPP
jgi:hypothetical protein